jgi:hypothetical protein
VGLVRIMQLAETIWKYRHSNSADNTAHNIGNLAIYAAKNKRNQ